MDSSQEKDNWKRKLGAESAGTKGDFASGRKIFEPIKILME